MLDPAAFLRSVTPHRSADVSEWKLDALAAKMVQYCYLLEVGQRGWRGCVVPCAHEGLCAGAAGLVQYSNLLEVGQGPRACVRQ